VRKYAKFSKKEEYLDVNLSNWRDVQDFKKYFVNGILCCNGR